MNIVLGHGFTCNPGEHIEGTSSPLFALLMTIPIALGIEPYNAASVIGKISFSLCVSAVYLTVCSAISGSWGKLLGLSAAAATASTPYLAYHSQTGMETVLFATILAFAFWRYIRSPEKWGWPVLLVIATLTRTEASVYFGLWLTMYLIESRQHKIAFLSHLKLILPFFVIVGLWTLFRVIYFDSWVPNSLVAKSGNMTRYFKDTTTLLSAIESDPGVLMLGAYISEHSWMVYLGALALVLGNHKVKCLKIALTFPSLVA